MREAVGHKELVVVGGNPVNERSNVMLGLLEGKAPALEVLSPEVQGALLRLRRR